MTAIFHSLFMRPLPITVFVINIVAIYFLCKAIVYAAAICFGAIANLAGKDK